MFYYGVKGRIYHLPVIVLRFDYGCCGFMVVVTLEDGVDDRVAQFCHYFQCFWLPCVKGD